MAEVAWSIPDTGQEVTLTAAQVIAMAGFVTREHAQAVRLRVTDGRAPSDELEFATWDPANLWFGPYTVRKISGHIIVPK